MIIYFHLVSGLLHSCCIPLISLSTCSFTDVGNRTTVKPVLSGHRIKRTPSVKRKVQNLFPLFALNETFIKRIPLLSGRGHLKST